MKMLFSSLKYNNWSFRKEDRRRVLDFKIAVTFSFLGGETVEFSRKQL